MTRRISERTIEAIVLVVLVLWTSALFGFVDISLVIGVSSLTLLTTAVVNIYSVMDRKTTYTEALYERGDIL
ncbi:MAG: hypothetical protein ACTSV2_06985 [Candidatus Thorarchaeota archaeon]